MADEVLGSFVADAVTLSPDVPGSFGVDAVLLAAVPGSFGLASGIGPWGSFTSDAVRTRTYSTSLGVAAVRQATVVPLAAFGAVINSGPVAFWVMERTGTTQITEYIAAKHGTANKAIVWTTGYNKFSPREAILDNGTMYAPTTFALPSTNEVTIETWFKTTSTAALRLWGMRASAPTKPIELGMGNLGFGSSAGQVVLFNNNDGVWEGKHTNAAYNDGNWHHVVAVWTGSAGVNIDGNQMTIYVDGAAVAATRETNNSYQAAPATGNGVTGSLLGARTGGNDWVGTVQALAIYARSLSSDEVLAHFLGGTFAYAYLEPMHFWADAFFVGTVTSSKTVDAVIKKPDIASSFGVEYWYGWGSTIPVDAIQLKTQSGFGALTFPGASSAGVGPGGAANLLTPAPIRANPGDTIRITFTALSGGNIGFFAGPTPSLAAMTQNSWTNPGALPYTFSAVLAAGNYYFWPYSYGYNANKTGAGYYIPGGGLFTSATLKKTIAPTFTLDFWWASIIASSFEAGAWIKATMLFGQTGSTVIRPNRDIDTNGAVNKSSGTTAWNLIDEAVLDQNDWINPTYGGGGDNLGYVAMGFTKPDLSLGWLPSGITITGYITCGAPSFGSDIWVRNPATGTRYVVISQGQGSSGYYSATLTTRPWDGQPWTTDDVAALVVGVSINYGYNGYQGFYLRQLYATVDWYYPRRPVDAVVLGTSVGAGTVDARVGDYTRVDAVIAPRHFTVDARFGVWFPADAWLEPMHFGADATLLVTKAGAFIVAAAKVRTIESTFAANAVIRWTVASSFSIDARKSGRILLDAVIFGTRYGSKPVDAIRWQRIQSSFPDGVSYQWGPGGRFGIDAFVHMYFRIDAWLDLGFAVNAVILSHVGPVLRPLSFPGASQTILGQTANALSPQFPIATGEMASVILTETLSDRGDLGFFNPTSSVGRTVPAEVGEHNLEVLPGSYYVYSSWNNLYRPGLTGAGSYLDYGSSSKTFTLGAFVQPTFRVAAEIVWHFEFTFPAAAWKMDRVVRSFAASSWVQPWFWVNAAVVPRHFHASAWIKCEIKVSAWLIRRVTGTVTVNAFVRGAIRVNAIKRRTMAGTFTVGAFKTAPVFGFINVSSQVGWYLRAQASIKLTKYRRFTADAVKRKAMPATTTADAFVQPWFTLNAQIFRREFFVWSVVFGEQAGSWAIDAAFVWHWVVATTADAFVQPYFRVAAIRHEHFEKTIPVSSWSIIRVFGSFTLQAGITGFNTDAVIHRPAMGGVFNVYAWKGLIHGQRTFSVSAEKSDPGAYWDPEYEIWLHLHFHVDAQVVIPRITSFGVDSSFAVDGLVLHSFTANARITNPEVQNEMWVEAFIDAQKTVIYEGEGRTEQVLTSVTERFTFPGWSDVIGGGENRITSLFFVADKTQVVLTVWDWGNSQSIGLISAHENLWSNITGGHSGQGVIEIFNDAGTTTTKMWPAEYTRDEHHVYSWTGINTYDPNRTGSGMVAYQRWDTVTRTHPAPTVDAFIVGTPGEPFTLDAEIVGREKSGVFSIGSELALPGEMRGQFEVGGWVLGTTSMWWRMDAELVGKAFTADAVVIPMGTIDAWIQPYFTASATIKKTMSWYPLAPAIDAVLARLLRTGGFTVAAETVAVGDTRDVATIDAVILGHPHYRRFYLAAMIPASDQSATIDAFIGHYATVSAWIQPMFTVNAHIRGSSYIIFPEDGGPPTDPFGNPPMIGRSFRVKIEAFIPDPIPVGNDAEIERLIALILEAEAELEAMYCAYVHYTPQGAPSVHDAPNPNPSGGGYNKSSTLPNALNQGSYPGAGDWDDCWVVATVWAANAAGWSYRPTVPVFRRYARNPDRPGPTGGTLDHVMRGAQGCYPNARIRRYRSTSWDGFTSLLKAGWIASLAIRSSGLPSSYAYGHRGGHQVGVAYQNGTYYIMNPLQPNGSRPRAINGYDLRRAARAFVGGTICAAMFG